MGHEVAVTSLQILNVLNTIANGGAVMRPEVVQRIVTAKGQTLLEPKPEVMARPITPETARLMARLLSRVTEQDGTGKRARVEGYTVAGKTGTAEKPGPGGYDSDRNLASFVGFLPAEDPAISIIVTVDEPQPLHQGGQVAAPVFREIAEQAVRYLDIPPVPEQMFVVPGDPAAATDM
jgi:cell division protein FtsI/penicillin-binding protein 2